VNTRMAAHISGMSNDTAPDAESAISHYRTAERILTTLPVHLERRTADVIAAQAHATLALAATNMAGTLPHSPQP